MDTKVSEKRTQSPDKPKESQEEPQVDDQEKQKESGEAEKTASVTSQTIPESQESELRKETSEQVSVQHVPLPLPLPQLEYKRRIIVKHGVLGNKVPSHDPNVLVESVTFTSIGKIQPFLITLSTNAALIMDYHSHLTSSEVVGYLAGSWDVNSHNLNVTHAFPCKCRLGDYESAPLVEAEIRKTINSIGLTLVGWYHSHPTAPPTPTIRDIETQLEYELRMKGSNDSTYLPCIGFICSPYNLENPTFESNIVSYWVVPPPENKTHEYGKPMMMSYSVFQDQSIPQDVLLEMKKCADFYKPEKDFIRFSEPMKKSITFLEKLKMSLIPKFPLNHRKSDSLWKYIEGITETSKEKSETEIMKEMVEIASMPVANPAPPAEKPKFNIPTIPPVLSPLGFKSASASAAPGPVSGGGGSGGVSYHSKSHFRSKSSGRRSTTPRDSKNSASLSNYFVGSDLAALFGSAKNFSALGLDPATKSLLNLGSLSLGGMFLPPMAAAPSGGSYKPDAGVGLMKPPPPPPSGSYYTYSPSSRSVSGSRNTSGSASSRSQGKSIPSTSTMRDMPPPNKVPKLDVHQMANYFIPSSNLGKNCATISNRPSSSTSKTK